MMPKSCPISRKYRQKILQQTAFHSADTITLNSSLTSSKCYLQSSSIQQKIPLSILVYPAQNAIYNLHLFSRKCHIQLIST
jgi:hypothetical protein